MAIRVLIVDDHTLFRQGLIGLIETCNGLIEVVGEAASGREAIALVKTHLPDVVLMDIYMPDGDGIQALNVIRGRFPQVKVVMLTSSEDDEHLHRAIQYGAAGYLLKDLDATELFGLIGSVVDGDTAFGLLKNVASYAASIAEGEEALTERELVVLRAMATGASNQELAEQFCISINTVKTHIHSILDKLHLENRTQVVRYAMKHGLVSSLKEQTSIDTMPFNDHPFGL